MHLLLTARLTCPRCGPRFGLILLADRLEDRRVLEGTLGCPNCRDAFPVRDGFGDLRAPPRGELPEGGAGDPEQVDPEETHRVTALLGVAEGPGTLGLVGAPARHAMGLTGIVPGVDVLALDADMARWPHAPRVNRLVSRPGIPLYPGTLRGVAVDGALGRRWLEEAARVVAPRGRVVVVPAGDGAESALEEAGLEILAAEDGTVVAARG